jgi:hypothetical protein
MGRLLRIAVVAYLGAAVMGRIMESRGAVRCECRADCWCKHPGLSLFRWVFPYGHSLRQGVGDEP